MRLAFNSQANFSDFWHYRLRTLFARTLACGLMLLTVASASAALQPDEVAIIAMANSEDSRHIAEYYAKARGIPAAHILLLEGKPQFILPRTTWTKKTRPAILKLLEKRKLTDKIRCLVTCWDVPLSIASMARSSTSFQSRERALGKERAARVAEFDKIIAALEAIGTSEPPRVKSPMPASATEDRLKTSFNTALQNLQKRSGSFASDTDKARVRAAFEQSFLRVSGSGGMLQLMAPRSKTDKITPEQMAQRAMVIGRIQGMQQAISGLEGLPGSVARDQQILEFTEGQSGLFGAIRWIDQQLHLLKKNESAASFDSELSMIFYADHSVHSWRPNPLHYSQDGSRKRRVMMVARLAAPTVKVVEKMIDDAIATEKEGLKGNVYIDARGLKPKSGDKTPNTYCIYDESLRDLAQRLRKHTSLTVVSDNGQELFQPGDCPGAALYCGWYSVRHYVDAFDWNRGAVGYHLASFEAKWLIKPPKEPKNPEEPWCPHMLQDGVCATLGPVLEPYLAAFPLPDDFFPLLLTGKMTLAEVYYRTKRFNSWMIVLVGDPLYTPYKVNPMMDVKNLPERLLGKRATKRKTSANPAAAKSK